MMVAEVVPDVISDLWQHQEDAVAFAMDRKSTLWHMGLGTGKSRCAITLASRTQAKTILILCPLSVCDAWREQHQRFRPNVQIAILNKRSVKRKLEEAERVKARAAAFNQPLVVVVNYESARRAPLGPWLERQGFDLLVLDEVHKTKSHKGATSKWCAKLAQTCKQRVGLTGTPMPHSPLDSFGILRALGSTVLGNSFWKFRQKYAVLGGFQGKNVVAFQDIDHLQAKMATLTFQASRDVLDLPDAIHERRVVDLSPKAQRIYNELDHDFRAGVEDGEITASNALVKLLRLAQITSGTASIDDETTVSGTRHELVDDSKQKALEELFDSLPADEPVVVFGRFKGCLAAVHRAAESSGRKSLELSGSRKELSEWQRGQAPILAVQIQAGGTGIDLTRAAYCVYISVGFALGDYEQSLARVHRPGQDRTVFYYHLVARGTVDESTYQALRTRKNLVEAVLDGIRNPQPKEETK
tara:strand:+ start:2124 stop:3536 length:1413 start_codon:yes stop_codon:yes gene_type:complete